MSNSRTPSSTFVPEIPRRVVDIPGRTPRTAARSDADSKRLIVGQQISMSGEITSCDSLVVEGTVDATLAQGQTIEISETGVFRGKAEIEEAMVSGLYEGDLTVRGRLLIKSTGQVRGKVRYGQLEVECGGELSGDVQRLEGAAGEAPRPATPSVSD